MNRALRLWCPVLFFFLFLLIILPLLVACGGGKGTSPTAAAEREWVLIRNPRFGATMAEPEYIWVDRREMPKTLTGYLFGEKHVVAPPDAYAKAGPPPGPGRIWRPPAGESGAAPGPPGPGAPPDSAAPPRAVPPEDRSGYVVFVDGVRLVIDLADGDVKQGSLIAITRRQRLTHPVTGEPLGELTLEVGRARIVEVQAKFSVAELIGFKPGLTVKPQDRVTVLPASP